MTIGIIPNTTKENIVQVVGEICQKLNEANISFLISNSMYFLADRLSIPVVKSVFVENKELGQRCEIVISIGGDGTMLNTANEIRSTNTPILGLNLGKLGFLTEFEINDIDAFIDDVKNEKYSIEERMTLDASCDQKPDEILHAINDIVIDKGKWPKMINLTIKVDDEYVATFSADGLIVATPTGSTGYSLSTGGPIVSPKAKAIVLSPISPHTLTMRPIVLSSDQKIVITAESEHTSIQVNCDGQRVYSFNPPVNLEISKSEYPLRLVQNKNNNYFEILRKKLYWGLDVRQNSEKK
ncbi:MAG: NAD(+)/NADH kinase [Bacteroidetes bacterium]|nr:NAD(+)/NADH kinase [Bacteroidota bacterium]